MKSKSMDSRRVLFVNFTGLGNGIAAAGLFRALEKAGAGWTYYHNECPALDDAAFRALLSLSGFGGLYPAGWRRFGQADWPKILAFIERHRINTIVNLRNEGPARDLGYSAFKAAFDTRFDFFDLNDGYERGVVRHGNLFAQHYSLLCATGLAVQMQYNWLRSVFPAPAFPGSVVLVPTSSQAVKNWPLDRWRDFAVWLYNRYHSEMIIAAGIGDREQMEAELLASKIRGVCSGARLRVYNSGGLLGLIGAIADAAAVVSNDTAAVHIAAALDVPAVGLYFSTDGAIWGGLSPRFIPVQSQTGLQCPEHKPGAGNCLRFYGVCDAPCKEEVTVTRVARGVERALGIQPAIERSPTDEPAPGKVLHV